ncbi:MAG: FIG00996214: hypothetical protein, partial [uncultured Solirubrobacterales bacterium]
GTSRSPGRDDGCALSGARVRDPERARAQVRGGADTRLRPAHRAPRRGSGALGGAQRTAADRRDEALVRGRRAGAAGRDLRAPRAVGSHRAQPALDEHDGERAAFHGQHRVRAGGAVHLRLRGDHRQVPPGTRGRRGAARVPVQRHDLLRRTRRPPAGGLDLLGQGGRVPPSRRGLEGDDGPPLRRQRLAPPAPRQLRAAVRLQGAQRARELGGRRGRAPARGRDGV